MSTPSRRGRRRPAGGVPERFEILLTPDRHPAKNLIQYPSVAAHRLYFHLTWSTLDRRPMIDAATREFLDGFFRRATTREQALVVELAILSAHVHLLIRTRPRFDLCRLAQMLKGGSSYAVNRLPGNITGLRWTREYSATTVSPRVLQQAVDYLKSQERRHPEERVSGATDPAHRGRPSLPGRHPEG